MKIPFGGELLYGDLFSKFYRGIPFASAKGFVDFAFCIFKLPDPYQPSFFYA